MDTSLSLLERLAGQPTDRDWQRLDELYRPLLLAWAVRSGVPADDAEDLVQDTLTVVASEMAEFEHRGPGAFRSWLRGIYANRLKNFLRSRRYRPVATGDSDFLRRLQQLESPDSELTRQWNLEHDRHVAKKVMRLVQGDVEPATWQAFRRQVIEGVTPAEAASELGMTTNAVLLAKSRVLKRLRAELLGFVDC